MTDADTLSRIYENNRGEIEVEKKRTERAQIKIAKKENLGKDSKADKGRFTKSGVVIKRCGEDSYLTRDENGRITKRRHYDMKGIRNTWDRSGEPSLGGDVSI
ncbi:hypothetical protein NEOKW01_0262 [Nematocida sp. AWRm80]|nr:hypothetical protein NEOKW01_0262 [Nematocida sp. AWRm80]